MLHSLLKTSSFKSSFKLILSSLDSIPYLGNRDYMCDSGPRDIHHMGATLHWGVDFENNRYYLTTVGV